MQRPSPSLPLPPAAAAATPPRPTNSQLLLARRLFTLVKQTIAEPSKWGPFSELAKAVDNSSIAAAVIQEMGGVNGTLGFLVASMMNPEFTEEKRGCAAWCFASLCKFDKTFSQVAAEEDKIAYAALLRLMLADNQVVLAHTMRALYILAGNSSKFLSAIATEKALYQVVCQLVQDGIESTQSAAARLIGTIAQEDSRYLVLAADDSRVKIGLVTLFQAGVAAGNSDPSGTSCLINAIFAIGVLSSGSRPFMMFMANDEFIRGSLFKFLEIHFGEISPSSSGSTTTSQTNCAHMIAIMSEAHQVFFTHAIRDPRVLRGICFLMSNGDDHARGNASFLVDILASRDLSFLHACAGNNWIQSGLFRLETSETASEQLRSKAISAIKTLSEKDVEFARIHSNFITKFQQAQKEKELLLLQKQKQEQEEELARQKREKEAAAAAAAQKKIAAAAPPPPEKSKTSGGGGGGGVKLVVPTATVATTGGRKK